MKTLVIGLGNPILGDDGVGWKVAEAVKKQITPDLPIDIECVSLGGIRLMEHLIGYQHAILIDAFALDEPIGSILVLKLSELPNYSAFHTTSAYDISLQKAIQMGRSMGAQLPEDITIVGITIKQAYEFSEELSFPVAKVIPKAAQIVLDLLKLYTITQ
jgi:hydrogenase maturation protease